MKAIEIVFAIGFLIINFIIVVFGIFMSINWRRKEKDMVDYVMRKPYNDFNDSVNKPKL